MPPKKDFNGLTKLKNDLKAGQIDKLYVFHGSEAYMKNYYLKQLMKTLVDDNFREFNLQIFEGNRVTPEQLSNAIDSYPAMAERKLIIINDLDLFKLPSAFKDTLPEILSDLPDYVCLVFYYDIIEFKQDKRLKINNILEKTGCFVEFSPLDRHDLVPWIKRRAKDLGKHIDDETCDYLVFVCGSLMTNLITEIEKAGAHSVTNAITKVNIDAVCTKVLDAVVFDLTDSIASGNFHKALEILNDLLMQKNDIIMLFSAICRHIQRLYSAKLAEHEQRGERFMLDLLGTRSSYYVNKILISVKNSNLSWLRKAVLLCGETDVSLKSANIDRQKTVELALLTMAANFGGNK